MEFATFDANTVADYQKCYGTHVPVDLVSVAGGPGGSPSAEDEVDIEDLASLAPKLTRIDVYEAPNNGTGDIDILSAIAKADNARVVSDSWGACETTNPGEPAAEEPFLAEIAAQVRSAYPGAAMISAGMTGDLEEAIAEGATHVRVGTALLGGRPPFVR